MKTKFQFSGILKELIDHAMIGNSENVDYIFNHLTANSSLKMTRNIDFALSLIRNPLGLERIKYYLFNGTLIQRNYASLYLNRLGEWQPVKEAYEKGLIDEIQAFAR